MDSSSICSIYPLEVANDSFSEHCPLYIVLTLLLGEMLDVARYGPHGGKLRLLCQGWEVSSIRTKQNQCFDRHFFGNSRANHALGFDG